LWSCNQHSKKIKIDDRVLIWICGKAPGIYAVGTVLDAPILQIDSVKGVNSWLNPIDGLSPRPRALVRYDLKLLENPLLKKYIQWDPELWGLSILRQPRGTNYVVTDEEWSAIKIWLGEI
jgi:hypothetical protein